MPSLVPGYEYDVFISYRQNDNRSGWVTRFVEDLREELSATIKEPVSIYFDENPHDGLQDTHHVDKSLEGKLKCLIFIPIVSRTYCDPKSFAWTNEFLPFCEMAQADPIGMDIQLWNGNFSSRILPIQIHDLDDADQQLFERSIGSALRSIDFIFRSQGVNRPLTASDSRAENTSRTLYRDQINKTANAIEGLVRGMVSSVAPKPSEPPVTPAQISGKEMQGLEWLWHELVRRNVFRAALTYLIVSLLLLQAFAIMAPLWQLSEVNVRTFAILLTCGLPIALILAWMFEISPGGVIRTTSSESYANPYPPYRKKPLTSAPMITVLVLSLMVMVIYVIIMTQPRAPKPQITIGVLAFESRSQEVSDRYIAEGLTDDIINHLIIVSQLRVTSDTKSKVAPESMVTAGVFEIAKTLDVAVLLMGSVERLGDRIIIRARLFDSKTSSYVWGQTFERTQNTLIDVQSEIVQSITRYLNVDLNEIEELRLDTKATEDATAYDYYLRGKSLYLRYNRESNDSAVSMFRNAIAKDSNYARAWAGLGDAFSQMYRFGYEEAWVDSGIVASKRAIRLDSNLSEAYKSLGSAYSSKRLYDKALPFLMKAVELNPRNERAVGNLGTHYFVTGNLPEALKKEKESAAINPKGFIPYYIIGWIYGRLGDYPKAEQWLKESLSLDSNFAQSYELLAYVYVAQGRKDDALALIPKMLQIKSSGHRTLERAGLIAQYCGQTEAAKSYFEKAISSNPNFNSDVGSVSAIGLGQILLKEGTQVKGEVLLNHALELNLQSVNKGSQDDDPRFNIAAVYAVLNKKEESLDWLQKAIDAHWLDYDQIAFNPWFDNLRLEPRYVRILGDLRGRLYKMRLQAD